MKCISLLLFLSAGLYATEQAPWLSPPGEVKVEAGYFYTHFNRATSSSAGTFSAPSRNSSLHGGAGVTFWPSWSLEAELYCTRTTDISFTYEAALATLRYSWLDDIAGDPISLVTGVTLSFPGERFLHQFSFPYHGKTNVEGFVSAGREWACGSEWFSRLWVLGGYGVASRGSGWVHTKGVWEIRPYPCVGVGFFAEGLIGLGNRSLLAEIPFEGYARVAHRTCDIGAETLFFIRYVGELKVKGWTNVYAHNFERHYWGVAAELQIPFGLPL